MTITTSALSRADLVGDNLKKSREALNLTQDMLAAKLGVTTQTVSRWERASSQHLPRPKHIRLLREIHAQAANPDGVDAGFWLSPDAMRLLSDVRDRLYRNDFNRIGGDEMRDLADKVRLALEDTVKFQN